MAPIESGAGFGETPPEPTPAPPVREADPTRSAPGPETGSATGSETGSGTGSASGSGAGAPPGATSRPARGADRSASNKSSAAIGYVILGLVTGIGLGGACSTCVAGVGGGREEIIAGGRDRVGVVELVGEIGDTTHVVRQIRELARREDLKALVIRIDSPGGAVAPSQEIYQALRAASKKKPVVASMGSVAASGGFWSAMGADYIFASPGTVTGSIGVITQIPDLRGIADALRFRMRTFKSGPLKDAGNPLREMTADDEALFTGLIDDIYGQFVGVIAERRDLELEAVKRLADGRVMTGRSALEAGLIDGLGGLYDAARKGVALAAQREAAQGKGVSETATTAAEGEGEDPTLVYPKKEMPSFLELLSEGASAALSRGLAEGIERAAAAPSRVEIR